MLTLVSTSDSDMGARRRHVAHTFVLLFLDVTCHVALSKLAFALTGKQTD